MYPVRNFRNVCPVVKGKLKVLGAVIYQVVCEYEQYDSCDDDYLED